VLPYTAHDCDSYFAYDHKYDEFAIRIAEGGIVPRHSKLKKPKATIGTTLAINSVSDQDTTPGPSELQAAREDKGVDAEIEVRQYPFVQCTEPSHPPI
jgi:hypothetical protein